MVRTEWNNIEVLVSEDGQLNALCLYERLKKGLEEDLTLSQIEVLLESWLYEGINHFSSEVRKGYEEVRKERENVS